MTWDPGNEPCFASWDFGALCQRLWWSEIQEGPEAAGLIERYQRKEEQWRPYSKSSDVSQEGWHQVATEPRVRLCLPEWRQPRCY